MSVLGYSQMLGAPRRTYATFVPGQATPVLPGAPIALTNGNLTMQGTASNGLISATIGKASGLHYWEFHVDVQGNNSYHFGMANTVNLYLTQTTLVASDGTLGYRSSTWCYGTYFNGVPSGPVGLGSCGTVVTGALFSFALNMSTNTLSIYKDGSTTASATITGIPAGTWYPYSVSDGNTAYKVTANFGATAFDSITATLRNTVLIPAGYRMGLYL